MVENVNDFDAVPGIDINAPLPQQPNVVQKGKSKILKKVFFDETEKDYPVVSIIITFCSGESYDIIYTQEKQLAPDETRIAVYRVNLDLIDEFTQYFTGKAPIPNSEKELLDLLVEVSDIEADCVLLNFECCSGCFATKTQISSNFYGSNLSNKVKEKLQMKGFSSSTKEKKVDTGPGYHFKDKVSVHTLLKHCIDKGYYMMFADFSVKAIINDWDQSVLGPLPFVKMGECSKNINLYFDPDVLKASESNQMRIVGELCRDGKAGIHCMSETIVFGLNKPKAETTAYTFKLLTKAITAQKFDSFSEYYIEGKYSVGHASMKYQTGAVIFFSAGHWIDLKDINVKVEDLEKLTKQYGGEKNKVLNEVYMNQNLMNAPPISSIGVFGSKKECKAFSSPVTYSFEQNNEIASKMIQKSSNCNYSVKNQLMKK